jgi:hypothetical protein
MENNTRCIKEAGLVVATSTCVAINSEFLKQVAWFLWSIPALSSGL